MHYFGKIKNIINEKGGIFFVTYIFKRLVLMVGNHFFWSSNKRAIINATKNKQVIIINKTIEWNYAFQRTQQLATQFSKKPDFCVIYVTEPTVYYDYFINIDKINDHLFCFSYKHYLLLDELLSTSKSRILYITNLLNYENDIKISYDKMVYEYIDELSLWFKDDMNKGLELHKKAIRDADLIVATATKLYEETQKITDKVILCENAGDYDFFSKIDTYKSNELISKISAKYDCILGYYGMLAEWFDFDLIKEIARKHNNWAWVLIGPTYPNYDLSQNKLENYDNIYILGAKPYTDLPTYIKKINILTIPFKLNDITASTSPVKLFEYMAANKPIITSNMKECRRYKSVNIYQTTDQFEVIVEKIMNMTSDESKEYVKILEKDAKDNTWEKRADMIIDYLNLY